MVEKNNIENSIIVLLPENKIIELLDVILVRKIEGEIYKEDFDTINQIIQDFFSRKKVWRKVRTQVDRGQSRDRGSL